MPAMQHVVLFHFPTVPSPVEARTMTDKIGQFPKAIEGIRACRWGKDVSGRAGPYQYMLVMEFASTQEAAAYQLHPLHQHFVQFVKGLGGEIVAFDFPLTSETDLMGTA